MAQPEPSGSRGLLIASIACFVLAFPVGIVCGIALGGSVASLLWMLPYVGLFLASALFGFRSRKRTGRSFAILALMSAAFFGFAAPGVQQHARRIRGASGVVRTMDIGKAVASALKEGQTPLPTDWTPRTPCCAQSPSGRCPFAANANAFRSAAWKAIGFAGPDGDYLHQYRITHVRGMFGVEGRADLDCDGASSLIAMEVIQKDGEWTIGNIRFERELE